MTEGLPIDRDTAKPMNKRALANKGLFLGMMIVCFIIAIIPAFVAFFSSGTVNTGKNVRSTPAGAQLSIPLSSRVALQSSPKINTTPQSTSTSPPTRPPVTQITTVDDHVQGTGSNQFNYVGGWLHSSKRCQADPCEYDRNNSWDNTPNDYVTLIFTGVQLCFYGVIDPKHGIGAVSIDGGSETMINFYAASRAGNQLLWTSPMLPSGTHTFKLRVTGDKDSRSSNTYVTVDRVDIIS